MPKSSKRFILHTDSLNAQGFRMLTAGADLSDFEKNPVLLFNHIRPSGNEKNQILPIGYWTDIELKDGEISAVPFFDDKDEFAMSIYHKVENGILKMCSAGAEPVETSNDPKLILPGQQLETVTNWKMKEGSICDIGANPDAIAVALYDGNKIIALSESSIKTLPNNLKTPDMSKEKQGAGGSAAPKKVELKKLNDAEKEAQAKLEQDELEKQLAEGSEEDDKDKEIANLKLKISELEEKLKLAEGSEEDPKEKALKLANAALNQRKITLAEKEIIVKLAINNYDEVLEMLKARKPAAATVKETLALADKTTDAAQARVAELSKKSYDDLFKSGELEFVKLNAPDVFKAIFKSKFGKEPKNL